MTESELRKLFKSKFENRELAPDSAAWDSISAALDRRKALLFRRKMTIGGSAVAAVSAVVLLVVQPFGVKTPSSTSVEVPLLEQSASPRPTETPVSEASMQDVSNQSRSEPNASESNEMAKGGSDSGRRTAENSSNQKSPLRSDRIEHSPQAGPHSQSRVGSQNSSSTAGAIGVFQGNEEWLRLKTLPRLSSSESALFSRNVISKPDQGFIPQNYKDEKAIVALEPHWSISLNSHLSIARGMGSAESGISGFGLGLGIDRYFEGAWSLSSGIGFDRRTQMALGHRFEGATYGFGATRDVLEVRAQSFNALEIPLTLGLGLGGGHRIRAGWFAAWLFDYGSESAHWHQGEGSDDWVQIASPDYDISSYFSAFDQGAILAWDYEIGAWGLGLEYRHGLVDLSRGFGAEGSEDFNRAVRINLSFDLDE